MLWLVLIAAGPTPSKAVQKLTTDRIVMRQAKRFPGLPNCNRNTILRRTNSAGVLCRMALLSSAAADGAGLRKATKTYQAHTLNRARYLLEAIAYAEEVAAKLSRGKKVPKWKFLQASRAISALCLLPTKLRAEAAKAPMSAPKVRAISSRGFAPGVTERIATCRCYSALTKVSDPVQTSNKPYLIEARRALAASGCTQQRLQVSKHTRYVIPQRSQFSKNGMARNAAASVKHAAPDRQKSLMRLLERHRGEIDSCAVEARKLGGNRALRARRMKRCLCPGAKVWRFSPGTATSIEEAARPGALVLQLGLNKAGRVKSCEVVIKK
jgi:hypothetical protein